MTSSDFARLAEVVRSSLDGVDPDTPLEMDTSLPELGLNSLGTVRMIMAIEEEFDVLLPDDALTPDTFQTFGAVWQLVSSLQNDQVEAESAAE